MPVRGGTLLLTFIEIIQSILAFWSGLAGTRATLTMITFHIADAHPTATLAPKKDEALRDLCIPTT